MTASVFLALPASAAARPGDLDSAYGERGARSVAPGAVTSSARAVAAAPDGSAVVVGRAIQGGAERVLVARLTPAGGLDPVFGGTGMVLARFGADPGPPQKAQAVALQPDGKALVAGVAGDNWFVARLTSIGALDPSFGAAGVVLLPARGTEDTRDFGPAGIAVRQDGRILLAGTVPDEEDPNSGSIVLLGLLADGKRDLAVGGDGLVVSQLGKSSRGSPAGSAAKALALLPDGRALVAGSATDRTGSDQPVVARYRAGGRLDASFGERGKRVVAVTPAEVPGGGFHGMALSPDGTIVVAGTVDARRAVVARLTPDGGLDGSFARGGVAQLQLGLGPVPFTTALGVAVDLAGRPVLRGQALAVDQFRSSVVLARLRRDGAFDCSFGSAGQARAFPPAVPEEDLAGGGAIAPVAGDDVIVADTRVTGRRAAAFVARFRGGAGTRPPAGPPAVTTGGLVLSLGRATMGIIGLIDPRCSTTRWAFEYGERSLNRRTPWQTIPASSGPQDICARLTGLRPGRRYRARLVARSRRGRASGAVRAFIAKSGADTNRCIA